MGKCCPRTGILCVGACWPEQNGCAPAITAGSRKERQESVLRGDRKLRRSAALRPAQCDSDHRQCHADPRSRDNEISLVRIKFGENHAVRVKPSVFCFHSPSH